MRFPLADWIDAHEDCRYQLGTSGMKGTLRHPAPTASEVRAVSAGELTQAIADSLGVAGPRVFLTHGGAEGYSSTMFFLARRFRGRVARCQVQYPEYPPLFDTASWAGFRLVDRPGSTEVAVVSQPRNPEGNLWPATELDEWANGAEELVIDETFREFSGRESLARGGLPHRWIIGSFTKFFAADDLRVGFVVVPPEEVTEYGRFHGLALDELPPYSIAGALRCLRALPEMRREIGALMRRNFSALGRAFPGTALPVAPLHFDRPPGAEGDELARRCLSASVLVCPGSFFGDPSGVRICLTRRSFPRDLSAYLSVRSGLPGEPASRTRSGTRPSRVRRLRAGSAPNSVERG